MADDEQSSPGTAAFVPDFDTGEHSQPLESPPGEHEPTIDEWAALKAANSNGVADLTAIAASNAGAPSSEPMAAAPARLEPALSDEQLSAPAQSVTVPGRYYYLKWWKLVLVLAGVWAVAAVIGLALFSWWYQSANKTPVTFVVLVYIVVCTVGAMMSAMVPDKPLISALAIALSSAVFASLVAAAALQGHYHCERTRHCVVGLVPY